MISARNKLELRLMLLPSLIVVFGVMYYPLVNALVMAFKTSGAGFTLKNYHYIFTSLEFGKSIEATLLWIVGSTPLSLILGLIFALYLNQAIPLKGFLRSLVMVAWVMPEMVAATIWRWLLLMPGGIVNSIIAFLGLSQVPWLSYPGTAVPAALLINGWKGFGWTMIIFLASLQSIPKGIYEAAEIDGSTPFRSLFSITLPLLAPSIVIAIILRTIWYLSQFTLIMGLTGGGPGYSMTTLPIYIYGQAFSWGNFNVAAAAGSISFLIMLALLGIYLYTSRRFEVDLI